MEDAKERPFPRRLIPATIRAMSPYPKDLEVRGDYFSSGIWTRRAGGLLRGKMVSHGDLALPDGLASQFTEWLRRHDLHGRKPGFDVGTFDATGRALAKSLQELVGSSTRVNYAAITAPSLFGWIRSGFRRKP